MDHLLVGGGGGELCGWCVRWGCLGGELGGCVAGGEQIWSCVAVGEQMCRMLRRKGMERRCVSLDSRWDQRWLFELMFVGFTNTQVTFIYFNSFTMAIRSRMNSIENEHCAEIEVFFFSAPVGCLYVAPTLCESVGITSL